MVSFFDICVSFCTDMFCPKTSPTGTNVFSGSGGIHMQGLEQERSIFSIVQEIFSMTLGGDHISSSGLISSTVKLHLPSLLFPKSNWSGRISVARLMAGPFYNLAPENPMKLVDTFVNELGPQVIGRALKAAGFYKQLAVWALGFFKDLLDTMKTLLNPFAGLAKNFMKGLGSLVMSFAKGPYDSAKKLTQGLIAIFKGPMSWKMLPAGLIGRIVVCGRIVGGVGPYKQVWGDYIVCGPI